MKRSGVSPLLIALILSLPSVGNVSTEPAHQPTQPPAAIPANVLVNAPDTMSLNVQRQSALTFGAGNTLVAAFTDTGRSSLADPFTGYARSTDGGATWTDMGLLPGNTSGGAPVMARDALSGRIYMSTYSTVPSSNGRLQRIEVYRSDDDGLTWSAPVNWNPDVPDTWSLFPTIAVDNFSGTGQGTVYLATTTADISFFLWGPVYVTRSTDGGATFSPSGGVRTFEYGEEPTLAVGPDHTVYVVARDAVGSRILIQKSTDFGVTFASPVEAASLQPTSITTNHSPRVAINHVNGHIYVAYEDAPDQDHTQIYLTRSVDGGATWSLPTIVNDDGLSQSHESPSIAITPDGTRLFVAWYDLRSDSTNQLREYWGAIANVSGSTLTVGPNFAISDTRFPLALPHDFNGWYNWRWLDEDFEDQAQALADNAFFYVTWTDSRIFTAPDGYQPDIRFAKIPVAGPGDIVGVVASSPATFDLSVTNDVTITLRNRGSTTLSGIFGTLSSTTPNVVIEQATRAFPDLPTGAQGMNAAPYRVALTCLPNCPMTVDLVLTVTMASGSTFTLPISVGVAQRVSIFDATVTEGPAGGIRTLSFGVRLSGPASSEARVSFITESGTATAPTFTSTGPITIPEGTPATSAPATPYPATVMVSGVTGLIQSMAVRLNGLTHTSPGDLDVLLVAPDGRSALVMSDVGGTAAVVDVDLTFIAGAPAPVGALQSGIYQPTNNGAGDFFAAPAPSGPYSAGLFGNVNPNGTWSLYVMDDTAGETGTLDSFSLIFGLDDFYLTAGELVFAPGSSGRSANVIIVGDNVVEPNETFTVTLLNPVNTIIVDGQATGTILNDDGANVPTAVADALGGRPGGFTVPAPGVLANDLSNGGGTLAAMLISTPASGTLVLAADGGFTYTRATAGVDSFTYVATNDSGVSSQATVSLTINAPPISRNDSYSTAFQATLTVPFATGLLANDTISSSIFNSTRVQIASGPANGSLTSVGDFGEFTYTPNAGFSGTDTFTYRVTSPVGPGNGATVTILVGTSTPTAPTAVNDSFSTSNQFVLTIAAPGVLANDNANSGGAMTATLVSAPAFGTHALNGNGSLTYTPLSGFVGTVTMTYRAVNSVGSSNIATITIVVTGDPGPPLTVADTYATTYQTSLTIAPPGVLANDSTNGGGAMTAVLVSNVSNGVLTLGANGSFTYTPAAGFAGTDTFTYLAANTVGPGTSATVTINVAADSTTVQAPVNLRVESIVGDTVTLRWDVPASGAQASVFVLEGGVSSGQVLASISTGSPSPVFTFVAPSGSFFIRMHGQLGAARSPASNEVRLHVNVPVAPSAAAGLIGLANGSALHLTWKPTFGGGAPTGTSLDVTGAANLSLPIGMTDRFSFAGVPAGTYTFRVRQTNAAGSSPPSNAIALTFPGGCATPQAPANLLGYRLGRTVYVMWDPPATGPAPASYALDVSGSFVGVIPTTGRALSGTVGPGTYHLRVQSVSPCGGASTPVQIIGVP